MVVARLRPQLEKVAGVQAFTWAAQELRGGGDGKFIALGAEAGDDDGWSVGHRRGDEMVPL